MSLAAFVAVLWLATLSLRPLFNPDEGRYAEIPREMLSGGDWVIPHLNGIAYLEKPPLQYWATALSLRVFGLNEFAARLYTALCALATLAAVWLAARRLWGTAAAWRAAAVLSSMLLFVALGQLLTLDMSLTLYMTVALVGFLLAQSAGARRAPLDAARVGRDGARGAHQGVGGGGDSGGGAGAVQPVCPRLCALAPPARGERFAAVCGDHDSLALARGAAAPGFPASSSSCTST